MTKLKTPRNHLIELTRQTLTLRSLMSNDHLTNIFSEMNLIDYSLIQKIWPILENDIDAECKPIHLKQIEAMSNLSMPQISKIVQHLQEKGLILWERDEEGTYILPSPHGRDVLSGQQQVLLEFFDRIIEKIGEEKYYDILNTLELLENVIQEVTLNNEE